jgi:hypothetical protein
MLTAVPLAAQRTTLHDFLTSLPLPAKPDTARQSEVTGIGDNLLDMPASELHPDIPLIFHALDSSDAQTRQLGAFFLSMISIRPDGHDLLGDESQQLAALLVDRDPSVRNAGNLIAVNVGLWHPESFVAVLKADLRRTDLDQEILEKLSLLLLRLASRDPETSELVVSVMQRPDLTSTTKIEIVMGIDLVSPPDPVISEVVRYARDPDPWVRARAVETMSRFRDPVAHQRVMPDLQQIADDQSEIPKVRTLAREAMQGITTTDPNIYPQDLSKK